MLNIFHPLSLAWNYINFSPQDIKSEEKKIVEIIPLKDRLQLLRSPSLVKSFCNVTACCLEMIKNTLFWSKKDIFYNAKHIVQEKNGDYKNFRYVPTINKCYAFIVDSKYIEAILKHERNETGEKALFGGGFPSITSKRILGDNLLSFSATEHSKMRKSLSSFFKIDKDLPNVLMKIFTETFDNCFSEKAHQSVKIFPALPVLVIEGICVAFLNYKADYKEIFKITETILELDAKKRNSNEEQIYQNALQSLQIHSQEALKGNEEKYEKLLQDHSKEEVENFIKLMFFAGTDTTSVLIEYLIYTLGHSDYKKYQEHLFEKWKNSDEDLPVFAKTSKDLGCIIEEALRLHPPSFEQTRIALQDLVIDNSYVIPKDTELHLFHFYSQRNPQLWGKDADKFIPERHLNRSKDQKMFPFSYGPTSCVGKQFTMLYLKIFFMTLISEYTWESGIPCDHVKGPVALKLEPDVEIFLKQRNKK